MDQATLSQDDALVLAYRENAFDIAGLAELEIDADILNKSLCKLYDIAVYDLAATRHDYLQLASVLYAMISVARNEYATHGHQEYWPCLRDQIVAAKGRYFELGGARQALFGEWFRMGLEVFRYGIPTGGRTHLSPILFHAGVTKTSLPGALRVVSAACDAYGHLAESLDCDVRSAFLENFQLHSDLRRLMASELAGATQLWNCLCRVVLAWKTKGDVESELASLPLALEPEWLKQSLGRLQRSSLPISRESFVQLRYIREHGEVRLVFPDGTPNDWNVTDGHGASFPVYWAHSHNGLTCDLRHALPEQLCVTLKASGARRTFNTRPSKWPGIWFHAANGNLENGPSIDSAGLAPGRWYVLFEGKPTWCSVPYSHQLPIQWMYFQGSNSWTAWEVNVPERSAANESLAWRVGDNLFTVPLAHRPGPKIRFVTEAVQVAVDESNNEVQVFDGSPVICLDRNKSVDVHLQSITRKSVCKISTVTLSPHVPFQIKVEPGIYQLREARGVGRVLLRFAVIPGLHFQPLHISPDNDQCSLTVNVPSYGSIEATCTTAVIKPDGKTVTIDQSTACPNLVATWNWNNGVCSALAFGFPVEVIRWRVLGAPDQYGGWSRETVFIPPALVAKYDAKLEIQAPVATDLAINDVPYAGKSQRCSSGEALALPLASYANEVTLRYGSQAYSAVIKSERPCMEKIEGVVGPESLLLEWKQCGDCQAFTLLAWDPFSPFILQKHSIHSDDLALQHCEISFDSLPDSEWVAIAFCTTVRNGFKQKLQVARTRQSEDDFAFALFCRNDGQLITCPKVNSSWPELLAHLNAIRISEITKPPEYFQGLVARQMVSCASTGKEVVEFLDYLAKQESEALPPTAQSWIGGVRNAIEVHLPVWLNTFPEMWIDAVHEAYSIQRLLRSKVRVGDMIIRTIEQCGKRLPDHDDYPIQYIEDLWLISLDKKSVETAHSCWTSLTRKERRQLQVEAAHRIYDFHKHNDLPDIFQFLPCSRLQVRFTESKCANTHAFRLQRPPSFAYDRESFLQVLGLDDVGLDARSISSEDSPPRRAYLSSSDRRTRPLAQNEYSLYWEAYDEQWLVETPLGNRQEHFIRDSAFARFPLNIGAKWTDVRQCLLRWSADRPKAIVERTSHFETIKDLMVKEAHTGPIHASILREPMMITQSLLGSKVSVPEFPPLNFAVSVAWQLAWVERFTAWQGPDRYLENPISMSSKSDFNFALAAALDNWPKLMRRCLALAELIYWTYWRSGVGICGRFETHSA